MSGPEQPGEGATVVVPDPAGGMLELSMRGVLSKGIRKRRSVPIMGYIGLNGSFKTATMIRDSLATLAMGRRVLSTVELLDPWTGNPHPLYERFEEWSQLHHFRRGDILLDEVTGVMDARDSGMPKHVRRILPQMRRHDVFIRWTGINWDNTDKRLRQVTQAVAQCRGFMPAKTAATSADQLDLWPKKRLAFVTTYDAQTLTTAEDAAAITQDEHKKRRARVLHRELWWGPGSLAFQAYNSMADVAGVSSDCPVCGGRRPEQACKDPLVHDELARAARVASAAVLAGR